MKKIKLIDATIISIIILTLIVGFFTYKHFRQTASKQIESTSKIIFEVFLRGVSMTQNPYIIKPGEKTFISIRNVPYTDLPVVNVELNTKKTLMPNPKGNPPFLVVDDYSQVFVYDMIVTVSDTAKITKDGAVVGGNKIKMGLPITLEGPNYKFNGTVSALEILPNEPAQPILAPILPMAPNHGQQQGCPLMQKNNQLGK
jgi:hypothetical protein